MPAWNIVGNSTYTKQERDVVAFRLAGDVSTLTVPLSWPIPKRIEQYLAFNTAGRILQLWQALVAQTTDPEKPAYVPFPDEDELHDVYTNADGSRFETFPFDADDYTETKPNDWSSLVRHWYFEQGWYTQRDLVRAFGEAMEALTGIPLEQSGPLLHYWLLNADSGEDVSESKPDSTSTKKSTAPRSSRRRTTSSPAA